MEPGKPKDLQKLYPSAKTAAERLEAEAQYGERIKNKWLPAYPALKIALFGGSLFFLVLALTIYLPLLWSGGNLPGIAVSFLAAMFIVAVGYAGYQYASRVMYRLDRSFRVFGLLCIFPAVLLLNGTVYGWFGAVTGLKVVMVSVIFAIVIFIIGKLYLRK